MAGQDLFTVDNQDYLITVDFFSDYWEIDLLPDTTSDTVVILSKSQFARFGIPETALTDNGPQFEQRHMPTLQENGSLPTSQVHHTIVKQTGRQSQQ